MITVNKERDFTPDELLSGRWLKLGQNCRMYTVTFNNNGTFLERDLFNENDQGLLGQWQIQNGMLLMSTQSQGTKYDLLIGASNGAVHSGIENNFTFFKLAHLHKSKQ